MKKSLFVFLFLISLTVFCSAQNVGINNTDPKVSLDIKGALAHRSVLVQAFLNNVNVPSNVTFLVIGGNNANNTINISDAEIWVDGRRLIIYNNSGFNAVFSGTTIPPEQTEEFICKAPIGGWFKIGKNSGTSDAWLLSGNNGINAASDFIGTTDASDLVFKTNDTERLRLDSNKSWLKFSAELMDTNCIVMSAGNVTEDSIDFRMASYVNDYFVPSLNFSTKAKGQLELFNTKDILNLGSDGFVGIGTHTGYGKLTVNHRTLGTSFPSISIIDSSQNNTSGGILQFSNVFGTPNLNLHGLIGNSSTGEDSYFQFSRNGYYLMRLRGDGNLGIGEGGFNPDLGGLIVRKKVVNTHAVFGDNTSGLSISSDLPGIHFNSLKNANETSSLVTGYVAGIDHDINTGKLNFYASPNPLTTGIPTIVNPAMHITKDGDVQLTNDNYFELGSNVTKEVNAGKIGYQTFTAGTLDIIGAGTTAANRKIKLWGEGGINTTGPLDVGGALKINGSSGTAGQVLTSNGTSPATWQSPPFSDNVRFAANIPENTDASLLTYTEIYNTSPTDITIGPTTITVNKSGLYKINGVIYNEASFTGIPVMLFLDLSLFCDGVEYPLLSNQPLERSPYSSDNLITETFVKSTPFSMDVYISNPGTIALTRFVNFGMGPNPGGLHSRKTWGKISGYLISE